MELHFVNNLNGKRFLKVSFGFGPKVGPKSISLSLGPSRPAAAAHARVRPLTGGARLSRSSCSSRRNPSRAALPPPFQIGPPLSVPVKLIEGKGSP
uniref:Uncharacterized protein n=1 Tax=Oryza glaberrima TaxID=4538 RepID=A0A679BCB7_ORYGL|nr:hypothetical protein [Oryza glaberrima]